MSICLCLSIHLYLSTHLYPFITLPICMYPHLYPSVSIHLSIRLCISICTYPSISSLYPSPIQLSYPYQPGHLSVHLCLSIDQFSSISIHSSSVEADFLSPCPSGGSNKVLCCCLAGRQVFTGRRTLLLTIINYNNYLFEC